MNQRINLTEIDENLKAGRRVQASRGEPPNQNWTDITAVKDDGIGPYGGLWVQEKGGLGGWFKPRLARSEKPNSPKPKRHRAIQSRRDKLSSIVRAARKIEAANKSRSEKRP